MTDRDQEAEVTVSVAVGSEPIQGTARLPGGEQRRFWGWMELVAIVQEVLEGGSGAPGAGAPGPYSRPTAA